MLPDDHPDRIQIAFDDHRLVNNAGLILPATLGRHLGLPQLVDRHLDLAECNPPARDRSDTAVLVCFNPHPGQGPGAMSLYSQ